MQRIVKPAFRYFSFGEQASQRRAIHGAIAGSVLGAVAGGKGAANHWYTKRIENRVERTAYIAGNVCTTTVVGVAFGGVGWLFAPALVPLCVLGTVVGVESQRK